ncbi:aryl-alcohol-oxidase from pleurotus Eryingii [Flagelloscypha sp. PMI_526]|nr:aryl-alcohol-oxidase from pleurotus Eryingii [Flagelloscypha sp. PMI_526]
MPSPAVCFLLIFAQASAILAKIWTTSDALPRQSYDFIVVGGGTSGLVLANRLSESNLSVLVLEAGGSHSNDRNITIPFLVGSASPSTMYDWNYTTFPQTNLGNRVFTYSRGHLLGGSSSINYMLYTRGAKDDYDRLARATGDSGWSWDSLYPYMLKSERITLPIDGHNISNEYNVSAHGHHGIHSTTLPGFSLPLDPLVRQAAAELPEEFPWNLDVNSGNELGIGWYMQTVLDGARASTATSYLFPFLERPNLDVLIGARALSVIQSNGTSALTTVNYIIGAENYRITARKEVIVSAGVVNTPHILLHSGIGNATTLESFGIPSVTDLPSVGQDFIDHVSIGVSWTVNSTNTLSQWSDNSTRFNEAVEQWYQNHTGVMSIPTINQLGFFRVPDLTGENDPSAGGSAAHLEILFSNGAPPRGSVPAGQGAMSLSTVIVSPTSRGTVALNSSDPLDGPIINPNCLSTLSDIFLAREAVKKGLRFVEAPVFRDYVIAPMFSFDATDDNEIDSFIQANGRPFLHSVGTAAISPYNASYGVLDPDLKVKGVRGLRVVDASVFPVRFPPFPVDPKVMVVIISCISTQFILSAHTQVAVIAVAERAADLIKATWT